MIHWKSMSVCIVLILLQNLLYIEVILSHTPTLELWLGARGFRLVGGQAGLSYNQVQIIPSQATKEFPEKISSTSMISDKETGLLLLGLFWVERNSTSCGSWWIRKICFTVHSLDLSGITSARGGTSGTFGRGSWCLHKNIQHLHLPQRYCNSGYYNGRTGMTLQNISRTISIRPCHKIQFHIIVSSQMTPSKPSVVPRLLRGCVQPWASRACRPPRTLPRPSP